MKTCRLKDLSTSLEGPIHTPRGSGRLTEHLPGRRQWPHLGRERKYYRILSDRRNDFRGGKESKRHPLLCCRTRALEHHRLQPMNISSLRPLQRSLQFLIPSPWSCDFAPWLPVVHLARTNGSNCFAGPGVKWDSQLSARWRLILPSRRRVSSSSRPKLRHTNLIDDLLAPPLRQSRLHQQCRP
jgi:hypothetical protein